MAEIGLMTNNDKYLLSYRYESIDRLIVNNGNGYGLVDTDDNVILPLIYDRISIVGKFAVTHRIEDDYMLMYTIDGKFVKQIWCSHILDKLNSHIYVDVLIVYNPGEGIFFIINQQGDLKEVRVEINNGDSLWVLAEDKNVINISLDNSSIGVFTTNGDIVRLGCRASNIGSNRFIKIESEEEQNETTLYDSEKHIIVNISNICIVAFFPNGNSIGKKGKEMDSSIDKYTYCFLNSNFNEILSDFEYIYAYNIDEPFLITRKDGSYYVYDTDAKLKYPYSFDNYNIFPYWGNVYVLIENKGKKMVLDSHFHVVLPLKYDDFKFDNYLEVDSSISHRYRIDMYNNSYIIKRNNGKEIHCYNLQWPNDNSIPLQGKSLVPVCKNGLWGLINSKFEIVVPFEYNDIYEIWDHNEGVYKGETYRGRKLNNLYEIKADSIQYIGKKYTQIHYIDKAYENDDLYYSDINKKNIHL